MRKYFLLIFISFSWISYSEEVGIKFDTDSVLSNALRKAEIESKLIFINCFSEWFDPCIKLSKTVFTQKVVGDFYNKNFVNLTIDMFQPEGRSVMTKYDVRGFPTLMFLNSKGELLLMHVGGGSSEFIVELGMSAINNIKYLDSLKLRILKGDRNTKVLLPFLKMMPFAINKDSLLTDYFNSIKKEELINSDSWELFYKYIDDLDNPQFQYLLNNRKIFVDKYTKPIIDKKISRGFDLYINKFYNDSVKILKLKTIDSCLYVEVLKNNFKCGFCTSNTKEKYYQLIAKTKFSFSEEKDIRPLEFSKISWFIYNNYKTYNDTLSLIKAKDWAYKACLALPNNHEINDTYAHILFELGKYDNAIIYEKNALSLAKEQKSANANFYYDELMKFEQSKK